MLLCLFMRGVCTSGTWNWPQLEVSFFSIEGCISVVTAVAVIALLLVLFKIMLILIYQFDNWLSLLVMECKANQTTKNVVFIRFFIFFFGSVGVISSLRLWSAVFYCSSNSPVNLFIKAAGHLKVNVWAWVRASSRLRSLFLIRNALVNDSFLFFLPSWNEWYESLIEHWKLLFKKINKYINKMKRLWLIKITMKKLSFCQSISSGHFMKSTHPKKTYYVV